MLKTPFSLNDNPEAENSGTNEGFTEDEFYKTGDTKKSEIQLPNAPHCRIALYRLSEQTEPKVAAVKPIEPMIDVKRLRKVSKKLIRSL